MLNHITIMGRLTRDPELRKLPSGNSATSVSIACDRDFAPKDGGERETDFVDIVAFGGTADHIASYYTKGRMIIVSGRLQIRNWVDKEGNKRRNAEVVADSVYFGESKKATEENRPNRAPQQAPAQDGGFPETMAMLERYGVPAGQSEFTMLDDDDAQVPF